ncbi:hypothetical protein U9M48_026167 [Paspalum notatum var. saurae]|uniref:Uncharacterized protein n=1 Tax=Paspalum notatum var. saurae TaxID=547442 RepID=A0AAQ3WZ21_PASNO
MEAAWASAVDRVTGMADSAKRFFLLPSAAARRRRRRRPSIRTPIPKKAISGAFLHVRFWVDILKRLQRQAFYDIMQLRERQDKVEKVLTLFKATKVGPFAEESTRVKGVINVAGSLARDSTEVESGISSRFLFQTTVRKKDSLFAELVTDNRYMSQENDHFVSPLVLSKAMYLSNINDSFSVAAVPLGARCDDFSTDPILQEEHWLASLRSSLRPPLLVRSHRYAGGLVLRSKNFAVSLAELISVAGRPVNAGEASRVYTGFGQISYQLLDDIKLTLSAALHGPSVIPRKRKPTAGGCIDLELKIDEDSRIGAWIEINKKSNSRLLRWALSLSDTPEDDLGWGVSLRRGTEAKPQLFQVEGFLNLHLGKKVAIQPGIMFNVDGRRCTPALVFHSSWSL